MLYKTNCINNAARRKPTHICVDQIDPEVDGGNVVPIIGFEFRECILGSPGHAEQHAHKDRGLQVRCPYHDNRDKFRTLSMDVEVFGPTAAGNSLETWMWHWDKVECHESFRPDRKMIRQYRAQRNP